MIKIQSVPSNLGSWTLVVKELCKQTAACSPILMKKGAFISTNEQSKAVANIWLFVDFLCHTQILVNKQLIAKFDGGTLCNTHEKQ